MNRSAVTSGAEQIAVAPDEILHAGEGFIIAVHHVDESRLLPQRRGHSLAHGGQHRYRRAIDRKKHEMRRRTLVHLLGQHLLRHRRRARQERPHIGAKRRPGNDDDTGEQQQQPGAERQAPKAGWLSIHHALEGKQRRRLLFVNKKKQKNFYMLGQGRVADTAHDPA